MPRTAIAQIAKLIGQELESGAGPSEQAPATGPMLAEAERARCYACFRRIIGIGRARHVRLVRFLPGITRPVGARQLVDRMVQPGVPLGGTLRGLRLAIVDDPALLAAGAPIAAPAGCRARGNSGC